MQQSKPVRRSSMNKRIGSPVISRRMVLAVFFLIGASLGCKMLGGGTSNTNSTDSTKAMKGIPAAQICQKLAHPSFENRSEYDGAGCSGSTYFGVKDTRTASYETDMRPSFSYAGVGDQGVINKVMLSMSKRPDGAEFFVAEADAVARMINDQPLPKEIESAITGPLSTLDNRFNKTWKIGNVTVELDRTNTDSRFYLTFQFEK